MYLTYLHRIRGWLAAVRAFSLCNMWMYPRLFLILTSNIVTSRPLFAAACLYHFPDADYTYSILFATAKGIMIGEIDTPTIYPRIRSTRQLTEGKWLGQHRDQHDDIIVINMMLCNMIHLFIKHCYFDIFTIIIPTYKMSYLAWRKCHKSTFL